jgi:hypothetical protein
VFFSGEMPLFQASSKVHSLITQKLPGGRPFLIVVHFLSKLINLAVPETIDERAINKKRSLNLWERNINHTLCLNSVKAIGCTIVNIVAHDLEEGRV